MNLKRFFAFLAVTAVAASGVHAGLFDAWTYKANLTLSGYDGSETLTDFPVLVSLTSIPGFAYGQVLAADGGDLRFTDASGETELNYEIESWNADGESLVWVQVPSLSGTDTSIVAHWGNAAATAPAYTTDGSTWSNGFVAVYHLAGAATPLLDSSPNSNALTVNNGVTLNSAGYVGRAAHWPDGTNDSLVAPDHDSLDGFSQLTIEAWLYDERNDTTPRAIASKRIDANNGRAYALFKFTNGRWFLDVANTRHDLGSSTTTGKDQWFHIGATFDGSAAAANRVKAYLDGSLVSTVSSTATGVPATSASLHLGNLQANNANCWMGTLDEVRISRVARSGDWLNATWKSAAANTDFISYGMATVTDKPVVLTVEAASVTTSGAVLKGVLEHIPGETTVTVFWGQTDEGTDSGEWDASHTFAAFDGETPAAFDHVVGSLAADTTWYVRHRAVSGSETAWSPSGTRFISGEVALQATTPTVPEEGPGSAVFTVTRPAGTSAEPLEILYSVGGTASEGTDYIALPGSVVIPANEISATVEVTPILDFILEGDETVVLTLLPGSYALGSATQAMVTILDFEPPVGENTNVWLGSGNASEASNWSKGTVPTETQDILLNEFSTGTMTWNAGVNGLPATVASWTQTAAYTNRVTIPTLRTGNFQVLAVTGNATLDGGSWYRGPNTVDSGAEARVWLNLAIGGNLEVGEDFLFDGENCGYLRRTGVSPGGDTAGGAAHGGLGGTSPYGYGGVYGSYREPATLGSGSFTSPYNGGGAIILSVGGDMVLNGTINANGSPTGTSCGASGGSVWITATSLSGTGIITAFGGGSSASQRRAGGGGGRIAIHLTGTGTSYTTFTNAFGGTISARGGTTLSTDASYTHSPGAAGTVYVETFADNGTGHMVLRNGAGEWLRGSTPVTLFNVFGDATITNETWQLASLALQKAGRIGLASGGTLRLPTFANIQSDGHAQNAIRFNNGGTLVSDIAYEPLVAETFRIEAYGINTFDSAMRIKSPAVFMVAGEFTVKGLNLDGVPVAPGTYDAEDLSPLVTGTGILHVLPQTTVTMILVR